MGDASKAISAVERLRSSNAERVTESDLILLADVVRHVVKDAKAGLKESAASVLDDLAHDAAGLFLVRHGDSPVAVTPSGPQAVIPQALQPGPARRVLSRGIGSDGAHVATPSQGAAPSKALQPGRAGWLELLRAMWVTLEPLKAGDDHLDFDAGQCCAMTRKDAARLFGVGLVKVVLMSNTRSSAEASESDHIALIKNRVRGALWTEAENSALKALREMGKSDPQIGNATGIKRQTVANRIGTKAATRNAASTQKKLTGAVAK
ncbi:MAG: hypothetical protein ABI671_16060 [Burkholderiales bacterium]